MTDCTVILPEIYGETSTINIEPPRESLENWQKLENTRKIGFLIRYLELQEQSKLSEIIHMIAAPIEQATNSIEWPYSLKFSEHVSTACAEFVESHRLNEVLERCLSKARQLFSNIKNLYAELDYFRDDEPEDIGHVVIRVEVDSDQQTALDEYDAWVDWMIENLPNSANDFFTITIKRL
jgi:hypothetical protein